MKSEQEIQERFDALHECIDRMMEIQASTPQDDLQEHIKIHIAMTEMKQEIRVLAWAMDLMGRTTPIDFAYLKKIGHPDLARLPQEG